MFASPDLCHFWKTRTQCLSGRIENNHGTLVGIAGFQAGMKHKTFRIRRTLHHSPATREPHNHLSNKTPWLPQACSKTMYPPNPPTYTNCSASSFNPSPSSAATVHSITSRAAWVSRRCFGRHEGSSEREGFGCGQFQKITQEAPPFFTQCRQQTGCIWRVSALYSALWLLTL
jgi:hypothetical protein